MVLAGCEGTLQPGLQGSGRQASEQRDVAAFERIDVVGQTTVTVASGEPSVTVRGDDNLLAHVVTRVEDGTLLIDERRSVDPRTELVVEVTTPQLSGASLQGSGDLTVRDVAGETFTAVLDGSGDLEVAGLTGEAFTAELGGSGSLRASGQVQQVDLSLSGSGSAELQGLAALRATVDVDGSGDALVSVSETLDASSSGSGDVIYTGDPQNVQEDVSGSGDIRPR